MQDNTDDSTLRRLLRNAGYLLGVACCAMVWGWWRVISAPVGLA